MGENGDTGEADPGGPALPGDATLESRIGDQLWSLMTVAAAVQASRDFEDFLELAAEEACRALGAASVSISRLEPGGGTLRTVVNVGDLGPGETRRPTDERYRLADFPLTAVALHAGRPYVVVRGRDDTDAATLALLDRVGKSSAASVPIECEGTLWGELYATTAHDERPFGQDDLDFLAAVAAQVAAGLEQAEYFSRLADWAYRDALTGLLNRRGFEDRLAAALAAPGERPVSLVLCDVDGLKAVNDRAGHAAGDALLRRVAEALRAAAATAADAVAARLGGDEFAVLVNGNDVEVARRLARHAVDELRRLPEPVALSCGVATVPTGIGDATKLLEAADAAQYRAKRLGRSVVVAGTTMSGIGGEPEARRRARRDRLDTVVGSVLDRGLAALDAAGPDVAARLRVVAGAVAEGTTVCGHEVLVWPHDATLLAEHRPAYAGVLASAFFQRPVVTVLPADDAWQEARPLPGAAAVLVAGCSTAAGGLLLRLDLADAAAARALSSAVRLLAGEAGRGRAD